ncbi:hypothetical protein EMIHUDRAFT_230752 [Emiliania huxleyi CCMP1516]|uniref:Uncharacterized protein n=2 Tax=Emiliania huxleyi TaxID=2903 RepID=A0A0D3K9Z3_EMIH1|nr:hypothetical protein EMIHUDRAFT_230752 [Emiliania huxleyi CCMP1516]EOD32578.1 hypothetical protein EMIHUDRAFT_230752 [Emiliania huxleyi CCMP1516]|eukprot:XP_005785007.1 hypothetical protein EMIHUDRAFT_230752 [Emiliania huxleyi CCMP1516]
MMTVSNITVAQSLALRHSLRSSTLVDPAEFFFLELLAEVEAEKRAKGKKGKKKKKGGGSGGAGPSQESEAPAEAAAAKPAPLDREGLLRLLAELHEDRIRFGITPETSVEGAKAREAA